MTSMFRKTINLALQKAKENNVSVEDQQLIESLIQSAFFSYYLAWKPQHTLAETKRKWKYFFNSLKQIPLDELLEDLKTDLEKDRNQWTDNFVSVLSLILKVK